MENAIRGARNPHNSWARMDSMYDEEGNFILGECLLYKEIATDVFRIVAFYIIRMLSIAIFIARFHDCTTSNRL